MKVILFIIISIVLLGCFSLSAKDWQEGWRDTAAPQIGKGQRELTRFKNFDFYHHKRKAQYSFELTDADLVFGNHREYTNYALVVYDYMRNRALLAARFLIVKNTDKTKPGKFRVTLIDIKYKSDEIIPVCDRIIADIDEKAHRLCAEKFMAMVKRGLVKEKEQAQNKVNLDDLAKEIEAKDEPKKEPAKKTEDKPEATKQKPAAEVEAESSKSKEKEEVPSSEISTIF
ncbi:MAG: hypothetical protein PHV82_12485 [Victivallaceae bacterium]|nr:hypothetical protein [Victivallaceae bacterium]